MARKFKLRPIEGDDSGSDAEAPFIDRREFMRHSFNTAAGVITVASLGSVGFASLLMGQSESSGGDSAVRYWVPTGAEDTVWYGDSHLEAMTYQSFVDAAASSSTGMAAAQGVWSGMPINAIYVPHDENKTESLVENKPRFQFLDGYSVDGGYVGSGFEMEDDSQYEPLRVHDNLIIVFSRCPHLCCIPGWQLVANEFTADQWFPNGTDSGGNKLFCICHSSRFDPTVIEKNRNTNRSDGSQFEYFGIKRVGGPAPVGMPLVPFVLNGDMIEALPDFKDWYAYCD